MKKSLYQLLIVLSLITLIIGGCSSNQSSNGDGPEKNNGNQSKEEPTVIYAAMQKHSSVEIVQDILKDYEEEFNVKVEFDVLPQEEIFSKTELALASNSDQYDIIMTENMFIPKYAEAEWLTGLNEFIESENIDIEDFSQGFLKALSKDDEVYAIPFYGESTVLMYNKEIFENEGIENPPETMEELTEVAEKLTKGDKYGIAMRGQRGQGMNVYVWAGFFNSFGGEWFQDGKPNINSPESIEAVEAYANLQINYSPPGGTDFTWDQVQLNLQQGTVAMAIDATNFASRIEDSDQSQIAGNVGYANVPSGPDGFYPSLSTWGLAIPEGAAHKEEAFDFISWVTSKEIQLQTAIEGNRSDVTRTSVFSSPEFIEKYNYDDGKWAEAAAYAFDKSSPDYRPAVEQWNQFGDRLGIALSEVMSGKEPKDALDEAQIEIEGYFK